MRAISFSVEPATEEVWNRTLDALDRRIQRDELRRCWSLAFAPNLDVLAIVDQIGGPAAIHFTSPSDLDQLQLAQS